MKVENRLRGMKILLVLLMISLVLMTSEISYHIGIMTLMFCAGYALRETLDRNDEE